VAVVVGVVGGTYYIFGAQSETRTDRQTDTSVEMQTDPVFKFRRS